MSEENSTGSIKIRVPDAFNGDKKKARTFLRSVKQYIRIEEKKFKSDADKIIWAMSYMPEGEAAQFEDNIYNEFFDKNKDLKFDDWEKKFKDRFLSTNMKADAMAELSALKQGEDTVDIFNAKFTALMVKAEEVDGMTLREIYKRRLTNPSNPGSSLYKSCPKH